MDKLQIEEKVNELIEDLKQKIEDISRVCQSDNLQIEEKLLSIRNKAINVLFAVCDRLYDALSSEYDEEDLLNSVEIVKNRSNSLYEEVLNKVNELKGDEPVEQEPEIKIVEEVVIEDNISNNEEEVIEEVIEDDPIKEKMSEKALDTLKGWLLPEGDER